MLCCYGDSLCDKHTVAGVITICVHSIKLHEAVGSCNPYCIVWLDDREVWLFVTLTLCACVGVAAGVGHRSPIRLQNCILEQVSGSDDIRLH